MALECNDAPLPGWFCMAHPLKCTAEGPERGDAAPMRCPKCGSQVAVTVFDPDDTEPHSEVNGQ